MSNWLANELEKATEAFEGQDVATSMVDDFLEDVKSFCDDCPNSKCNIATDCLLAKWNEKAKDKLCPA
jgi:hypothetical protein